MRRKEFLKASFNADEQRLEYQMSMGSRCLKALILSVAATMSDKYLNKLVRELVALQTSRKQPAKTSPRPMKREAVCEIQTAAVPAKAYKPRFDAVCFAIVGSTGAVEGRFNELLEDRM